jgi:hypothetical protein
MLNAFARASRHTPHFILVDLDRSPCAPALIRTWFDQTANANLIFRVAVHEVESWILADRTGFAALLGISAAKLPAETDGIDDPKMRILELAASSKDRTIRSDITRTDPLRRGPGYNARLGHFVRESWNPAEARTRSGSLDRAWRCLATFNPQLGRK